MSALQSKRARRTIRPPRAGAKLEPAAVHNDIVEVAPRSVRCVLQGDPVKLAVLAALVALVDFLDCLVLSAAADAESVLCGSVSFKSNWQNSFHPLLLISADVWPLRRKFCRRWDTSKRPISLHSLSVAFNGRAMLLICNY